MTAHRLSRETITWRYLPTGNSKHAIGLSDDPNGHNLFAICGTSPGWFLKDNRWWGANGDGELAHLNELPECKRCAHVLMPEVDPAQR